MKLIWFQKTGVDLFMKIYVRSTTDYEPCERGTLNIEGHELEYEVKIAKKINDYTIGVSGMSMLYMFDGEDAIISFNNGWEVKPKGKIAQEALKQLIDMYPNPFMEKIIERNAECCFNIMKELNRLGGVWCKYIGNLSDYFQHGLYEVDGIFDCVEDMVENIDEEIWGDYGVLDSRVLIIELLNEIM